jgi:hypothetical protein
MIAAIVVERPDLAKVTQHLCLDKGYDNPTGKAACQTGGHQPHIRRIGEESSTTTAKGPTPRGAGSPNAPSPGCRMPRHPHPL